MRFKFEETEKIGTLHLSGGISGNDRTELMSLLEKTASMCSTLIIDISRVEKISDDCLELLRNFVESGRFNTEKKLLINDRQLRNFTKNSPASF